MLLLIETKKGYQTFEFDHRGQITVHNPQIFSNNDKSEGAKIVADSKGNIHRFNFGGSQESEQSTKVARVNCDDPKKEDMLTLISYSGGHA